MNKHLVLGKGNLGTDLYQEIKKLGHDASVMTSSTGFTWPKSIKDIMELQPDYIWVTAGAGSVEAVKQDFGIAISTHVTMPIELLLKLPPSVKICLISSDYVASFDEPQNPYKQAHEVKSLYALTKKTMEDAVKLIKRPNTSVVRVGSLYGAHYPLKTFPGKLKQRYPVPCELSLPSNYITPTPTSWIAQVLLRNTDKLFLSTHSTFHHCGPSNGCMVVNWGQKILGKDYTVNSKGFDETRPSSTQLGCTLEKAPTWDELWSSAWWGQHTKEDQGDVI